MKRFALTLAAGLLALPAVAGAQTRPAYAPEPHPQQLPHSRWAITPFIGARVPYNTGTFYVTGANGADLQVEEEREGSPAVGVNADFFFRRVFGLTAGVAYSSAPQDIFTYGTPGDSLPEGRFITDAPSMWFAKAGITARLPDPRPDDRRFHPSAFVTVGPAIVFVGEHAGQERTQHFALNLGADATTRIGRTGFAFQIGLEDYITFWNTDDFLERDAARFGTEPRFEGEPVAIDYNYSTGNILMARFGISYHPTPRGMTPIASYTAPPAPVSAAPAAPPVAIRYCVVRDGELAEVEAFYDAERADTLVDGRPLAMAYPADALPYAGSAQWYINHEPLMVRSQRTVKYGLPRRLAARELRRVGEYRGVPVFAEAGVTMPDVFYVPVRPGCEFQPYQNEANVGSVRG
ncbi:MAG TPA: hypothetical protein VK420_18255 [Longimicrobium sp.]|nr:hypothetical protein [Longimicrobium sp.]